MSLRELRVNAHFLGGSRAMLLPVLMQFSIILAVRVGYFLLRKKGVRAMRAYCSDASGTYGR